MGGRRDERQEQRALPVSGQVRVSTSLSILSGIVNMARREVKQGIAHLSAIIELCSRIRRWRILQELRHRLGLVRRHSEDVTEPAYIYIITPLLNEEGIKRRSFGLRYFTSTEDDSFARALGIVDHLSWDDLGGTYSSDERANNRESII